MDALIYTAMSAAERTLRAQQIHANNLANLDTGGFRADLELATTQAVQGYGYDARHMSRLEATMVSGREGPLRQTGRELDVAIGNGGYLAVQYCDGDALRRARALPGAALGTLGLTGS